MQYIALLALTAIQVIAYPLPTIDTTALIPSALNERQTNRNKAQQERPFKWPRRALYERDAAASALNTDLEVHVNKYPGRGTYFYPGLGACGTWAGEWDNIVALNAIQYGDLGRISGHCFRQIRIVNVGNGKATNAMIQDACPGCPWGGLDLSPSAFQQIAAGGLSEGVLQLSWYFLDEAPLWRE